MKNYMISILSATLMLALTPAFAQKSWSLAECISYAKDNNIQIQQAAQSALSSEEDVKTNKAAFFPSLTFSTSHNWYWTQQNGSTITTGTGANSQVQTSTNPTYNGSYNLNLSVTLYDGLSNVNTLKKSKLDHQSDIYSAEMTANNVEIQIIQAYYQILYAHESVLTNEEILKVAERELERTKAKLEVGKGSKLDVAQMESQYQQNYYNLVNARNTEASNILNLKQLLQLDNSADFQIDYQSFSDDDVLAIAPSVEEAQQLALTHLPDMKAAELDVQSAELAVKIAKSSYQPTLSLMAGVSTSNNNRSSDTYGTQLGDNMNESVGLNLSVPIWDGRRTRSSVNKAKIAQTTATLNQSDTRLQICNTISTLHLDILSAQARYESAVKSEASAKESFELMEERFNVGLESVIDLLTEKNSYLQARQETLQSKFTSLLNLRLMDFYTGMENK
ncbi:MAG: TolC family protein [Bacteroidales bacterium]|nr:TolC family protein [Bacteroidales bacterium]